MNVQPFNAQAKTLQIAVTSTASTSKALPALGNVIRIVNEGPNTAYISIGTGAQTATVPSTTTAVATSTPVMSGEDCTFSIPAEQQNISAICSGSGTATINVQVGEGA